MSEFFLTAPVTTVDSGHKSSQYKTCGTLFFLAYIIAGAIEITGDKDIDKTMSKCSLKCFANLLAFL